MIMIWNGTCFWNSRYSDARNYTQLRGELIHMMKKKYFFSTNHTQFICLTQYLHMLCDVTEFVTVMCVYLYSTHLHI